MVLLKNRERCAVWACSSHSEKSPAAERVTTRQRANGSVREGVARPSSLPKKVRDDDCMLVSDGTCCQAEVNELQPSAFLFICSLCAHADQQLRGPRGHANSSAKLPAKFREPPQEIICNIFTAAVVFAPHSSLSLTWPVAERKNRAPVRARCGGVVSVASPQRPFFHAMAISRSIALQIFARKLHTPSNQSAMLVQCSSALHVAQTCTLPGGTSPSLSRSWPRINPFQAPPSPKNFRR